MFPIQRPIRPRASQLSRVALPFIVAAGILWLSAGRIADIDVSKVTGSLGDLSAGQWLGAVAATAAAYLAAANQERVVVAHLGLRPGPRRARGAALSAAAVAQTVGFGPVVGAIIRRRLLPSLSMTQSFAVSAGITLAFLLGLGVLTLGAAALGPETDYRGEARAALLAILVAGTALFSATGPNVLGLRKPSGFTLLRLGLWVSLDCLALCLAFWSLLPPLSRPDLLPLLPVFLLGLGVGLASGCPAGAGPFEAMVALHLPGLDTHDLLASLLAFRLVAYAMPAFCGGAWALLGPSLLGNEPEETLAPAAPPSQRELRDLPWAEAQLVRQGELGIVGDRMRAVWVSTSLGTCRLFLGQPVMADGSGSAARESLEGARDLAQREAVGPLLYKIGPRLALAARRKGWAVLPVAREAVLDPGSFHTSGSAFAGLRRKMRVAEKAGVVVEWPSCPPWAEMEAVSREWVQRVKGERRLSMGRWGREYVAGQRVAVARDASGKLVAFVTFHAGAREWTLDLMRSADVTPDGTLYLLVAAAIQEGASEGLPRLSLAAVPDPSFGLADPLAQWARHLNRSARGLEQFKQAFQPKWERRYIAAPGRIGLAVGAIELALAIRPGLRR